MPTPANESELSVAPELDKAEEVNLADSQQEIQSNSTHPEALSLGLTLSDWNEVKRLQTGTVSQSITDAPHPTGPLQRTLTYTAPFTRQDRETDYHTVWQKLETL